MRNEIMVRIYSIGVRPDVRVNCLNLPPHGVLATHRGPQGHIIHTVEVQGVDFGDFPEAETHSWVETTRSSRSDPPGRAHQCRLSLDRSRCPRELQT